ncbi:unnamed protein product, partial [Allacma fusca]
MTVDPVEPKKTEKTIVRGSTREKKRSSEQTGSTSSFEFKKPKSDAGTSKLKHGDKPAGFISLCKTGSKDTIEVPNVVIELAPGLYIERVP